MTHDQTQYGMNTADALLCAARQSDVLRFYDCLRGMAKESDDRIQAVASSLMGMPGAVLETIAEGLDYSAIGVPGIRLVPVLQVLRDNGVDVKTFYHARRGYELRAAIIEAARAADPHCGVGVTEGLDLASDRVAVVAGEIFRKTGVSGNLSTDGNTLGFEQKALLDAAKVFRPIRMIRGTLACRSFKGTGYQAEIVQLALTAYGHVLRDNSCVQTAVSFGEMADRIAAVYDTGSNPQSAAVVSVLRELHDTHKLFGWDAEDQLTDEGRKKALSRKSSAAMGV